MIFFSSRRRHTRWNCDWSSDVCSSDLCSSALDRNAPNRIQERFFAALRMTGHFFSTKRQEPKTKSQNYSRSEERRVGKECRSRRWQGDKERKPERVLGSTDARDRR